MRVGEGGLHVRSSTSARSSGERQASVNLTHSFGPNTLVLSTQWIDYCTSAHVKGEKNMKFILKSVLQSALHASEDILW